MTVKIKIEKVLEWKPASTFRTDDGQVLTVQPNQKFLGESDNDPVQLSIITDTPLTVKKGDEIAVLLSSAKRSSFGWTVKGTVATSNK